MKSYSLSTVASWLMFGYATRSDSHERKRPITEQYRCDHNSRESDLFDKLRCLAKIKLIAPIPETERLAIKLELVRGIHTSRLQSL